MPDSLPDAEPASSLYAVLVLYNQSLEDSVTFQSLSAAVRALRAPVALLVYDNSPSPVGRPAGGPYPGWDIEYIHDPANPGVSQAYVTGARMALARSKRWLLLLDQDTWFPPDALQRYLTAMVRYPGVTLFAPLLTSGGRIISPCRYRFKLGFRLARVALGLQPLNDRSILNSGMCVALDEYLAVGGHDVRIVLDFADHEFIERYKRSHDSFVVVDAACGHDFFRSTVQGTASHLTRFRFYCSGAKYASKGLTERLLTAAVIGARACLLSVRHGSLQFLRIAAGALLGGGIR